jgi:hypothetical protein
VKSLQSEKKSQSSSKEALDLLEAVKFVPKKGTVNWEEDLVDQIVNILSTHPVSRNPGGGK